MTVLHRPAHLYKSCYQTSESTYFGAATLNKLLSLHHNLRLPYLFTGHLGMGNGSPIGVLMVMLDLVQQDY